MEKLELSRLLKQIRRFEKEKSFKAGVKIAVLGSFSVQYFVRFLKYFLVNNGLSCDIYEGEYNSINMEILNPDSGLYRFSPDYIVLLPYYEDVKEYPALLADDREIHEYLENEKNYYKKLWEKLSAIPHVKILQSNFVLPPIQSLGNLEYQIGSSRDSYLKRLNEELIKERSPYVTIVDADSLSCKIGKYNWFDYSSYFLNKAGVRLEYMPEYVMLFVRQINALQGNTKKCLVLDLDNTLWGGVVGDDGWEGIQLDPNHAVGEAYRFFQKYILSLKERGVILAVCSKNEELAAKEPFQKNENMLIHLDDISCFKANWDDKAGYLRKIAEEMNIGTDSMVFFDDNPAEREIVRTYLPEVHVVEVPTDPAMYVLQMEKESPFEWLQLTNEDLKRTDSYKENRKRKNLQAEFVDYDEYLNALEMKGSVDRLKELDTERFVQLINKSNQFNLRTIRYSESEIRQMKQDENCRCLSARLMDKYSDYGLISCVILKKIEGKCFIDTWVMSCRVLKRGVESMMFEAICRTAHEMNCTEITAEYRQTKKNAMVKDFYESLNFKVNKSYETPQGVVKEYSCDCLEYTQKYFIKEEL